MLKMMGVSGIGMIHFRASSEDYLMSRLAWFFRLFPYGRNVDVVVSTLMDKDRRESSKKRKAQRPRCV